MDPAAEHVLKTMRDIVGPEGRTGEWYAIEMDELRRRLFDMKEDTFQSALRILVIRHHYDPGHNRFKF